MNEITFNQELIDDIYSSNVQNDLHSIKDFLRWTYTVFNRADIFYGHGYDNPWDEAQQLVLATLHLPPDFPSELYDARLTMAEKSELIRLVMIRLEKLRPYCLFNSSCVVLRFRILCGRAGHHSTLTDWRSHSTALCRTLKLRTKTNFRHVHR